MNPIVRGWGQYYKRSRVRKLFTQLDAWIVRRWRCEGWKQLPQTMLYGELGLVSLLQLDLLARSP
jgi:RNA-directed DNA polymerase